MGFPFGLSREDLLVILREAYRKSRTVERGRAWSDIVRIMGYKDYHGEELELPYEMESHEELEMVEDTVGFCRNRKTGRVYVKTLFDYAREKLVEEYGEEPDEDEIAEYAYGFCEVGGCNPPEDFCGRDEYLGDLHTHPYYPMSPSCQDVKHAVTGKLKVMCIASKDTFACVFAKPEQMNLVPCRSHDFDARVCIPVKTYKEDAFGVLREEEYMLCPEEFLEGHEEAWINEVRSLVREGKIMGVCYKVKTPSWVKEKIVCEFGKERVEFSPEELESS